MRKGKNGAVAKIPKARLVVLKNLLGKGLIYDLGQPYHPAMPHYPLHPAFLFSLTRKHGDYMYEGGISAAAEMFTTGGHVGTHLDSLGHISKDGKLFGGIDAARVQDYSTGLKKLGIDQTPPIVGRGVLLDVAAFKSVDVLDPGFTITAAVLRDTALSENVSLEKDDIALIRTGWARYWNETNRFASGETPGPNVEAAEWLASRGIRLTGSDTIAFERMPSHLPVHRFLLVEKGIQIMEMLNLEQLSRDRVFEFLFMVSPLKIKGGTASPVRPVAIV